MLDGGINVGPAEAARQRLVAALLATADEDQDAFRSVYRATSSKLFGICLRICGNRQAAEDVLQEVYLTVWRRAGAYDPGRSSPVTWLATIARNRAIDWRRSRGLPPPGGGTAEADLVIDPAARPGELMMIDEADRQLHRCLDELDPDQQDVIRTAFFEGLTYSELADRKAVPLGTMKSRVRRGLARLKVCLDE